MFELFSTFRYVSWHLITGIVEREDVYQLQNFTNSKKFRILNEIRQVIYRVYTV